MSTASFGESQATSRTTAIKSCSYRPHFERREINCHLRTVTPNFGLKIFFFSYKWIENICKPEYKYWPTMWVTLPCGGMAKSPKKAWMSHTSGTFFHKNKFLSGMLSAFYNSFILGIWALEEWAATGMLRAGSISTWWWRDREGMLRAVSISTRWWRSELWIKGIDPNTVRT